MQAAVGPKVISGVALAGASLIAVTPVASPPDIVRLECGCASDLQ